MNLFDNTMRDGGNVVGHGFSVKLTKSMIEGLLKSGIQDIEMGNCKGLGAYQLLGAVNAPSDEEYLDALGPYVSRGRIGMFMLAKCAEKENVRRAAEAGLHFIRVGANAGDGESSAEAIRMVKDAGLVCRYSLMKAYVSSPEKLAEEARMLEHTGVDKITIMDSAGTMYPKDAAEYVTALKRKVSIPVGFHGHSNLGLSQANALAAVAAGADEIDCGLLGMARSAGNCTTELAAVTLKKEGYLPEVDIYRLLDYLEKELIPAMETYHYHVAVKPNDLMMGYAGCHSNFLPMFEKVAAEEQVPVRRLITEVSAVDRKNPSEEFLRQIAGKIRGSFLSA